MHEGKKWQHHQKESATYFHKFLKIEFLGGMWGVACSPAPLEPMIVSETFLYLCGALDSLLNRGFLVGTVLLKRLVDNEKTCLRRHPG